MKLSFSTKGWHDNTFEEFCDIAQELKFEGIELHNIHNRLFTERDGAFHDYAAAATVRRPRGRSRTLTKRRIRRSAMSAARSVTAFRPTTGSGRLISRSPHSSRQGGFVPV